MMTLVWVKSSGISNPEKQPKYVWPCICDFIGVTNIVKVLNPAFCPMFCNLQWMDNFPDVSTVMSLCLTCKLKVRKNVQPSYTELGFKGQFMLEWLNELLLWLASEIMVQVAKQWMFWFDSSLSSVKLETDDWGLGLVSGIMDTLGNFCFGVQFDSSLLVAAKQWISVQSWVACHPLGYLDLLIFMYLKVTCL